MDSPILGELLAGPGGFLVGIAAFVWLAFREWRKARAEDVAEARADLAAEQEKRVRAEAAIEALRTTNQLQIEGALRRYYRVREIAIERGGIPPEELP